MRMRNERTETRPIFEGSQGLVAHGNLTHDRGEVDLRVYPLLYVQYGGKEDSAMVASVI